MENAGFSDRRTRVEDHPEDLRRICVNLARFSSAPSLAGLVSSRYPLHFQTCTRPQADMLAAGQSKGDDNFRGAASAEKCLRRTGLPATQSSRTEPPCDH
jgi:hypothetical protein